MSTDSAGWIVVVGRAWMNPTGHGMNYYWHGEVFTDKALAVSHGFVMADSDDFNLGRVEDGRLVSLWWMDNNLDESAEVLAEIERQISLKAWSR